MKKRTGATVSGTPKSSAMRIGSLKQTDNHLLLVAKPANGQNLKTGKIGAPFVLQITVDIKCSLFRETLVIFPHIYVCITILTFIML